MATARRRAITSSWTTSSAPTSSPPAAAAPPASPFYDPPRIGEIARIALAASRARAELGWQPTVPFVEGVRRTIAHLRAHNSFSERILPETEGGGGLAVPNPQFRNA